MPPKGSGGKAKANPKDVAVLAPVLVPSTAEFSMELRGGETDRSNTEYLLGLEDALNVIDTASQTKPPKLASRVCVCVIRNNMRLP